MTGSGEGETGLPSSFRRALLVSFLVGLVLRLGFALLDPITPVKDAAEYHALAVGLASGQGYVRADGTPTAFRPPGLPLLLGGVYAITGPDPRAGRVTLALASALLVPLLGLLGLRAGGERGGRIAAWLTALYPAFVASWFGPRSLLAEPLLTTLAFLSLALAVEAAVLREGRGARLLALGSGLAAGAAVLTKGTQILLPALLALFLLRSARRAPRKGGGLALPVLALLGAGLVLLPWTIRNALRFDALVPVSTNGGISLWASYNPASRGLGNASEGYTAALAEDEGLRASGMGEPARSSWFSARTRAEIAARPARAIRLVLRKALLWADPTYEDWTRERPRLAYAWGYGAILPLALAGLVIAWRRPDAWGAGALLVAYALMLSALHVLFHVDVRYRVTAEPVGIVLGSRAVAAIASRLGGRPARALGAVYALLHALIAWQYASVFALLSRLTRALGLG